MPRLGEAHQALVTTTTLQVSGDTYLQSGSPNQNLGGDTRLSLQSSGKHRTLLFVAPSNIATAVGNGTLVSASVELALSTTGSNWGASGRAIAIHRLKQASAEYQATWNCALDANVNNQQDDCTGSNAWSMNATATAQQPWLSPATATTLITNGQTGNVSFDVTPDVAAILAGTYAGHGWLIKKVDENQNGSLEFASRELGSGPRLVLQIEGAPTGGGGLGPVAGSASLAPSADTQVRQGEPNQNFGSDSILRIQASGRNRALIDFDAAAVTSALEGALVRARLALPIAETANNWGLDRAVGAHRLRHGWSELGATWNCAVDSNTSNSSANCSGDTAWVLFGAGTAVPWVDPPTSTTLVSSGQTGILELDVTRDVACALAGFTPLDGWIIKKELESQNGKIELRSRETSNPPSLLLEWTNGNGVVVTAADCNAMQPPPNGCTPTAPVDTTCNGVDDDCDGLLDDDVSVTTTSCGIGACEATGESSCVAGQFVDSCIAGLPALNDTACNLLDDDCNGVVDEDYVGTPTSCGIGACSTSGLTECVLGQIVDDCQPDDPAPADTTCDGIDDDCNGTPDEDYVAVSTQCGLGACSASGTRQCVGGQQVDSCTPGTPAASDASCNGSDDDCNGTSDEDYVGVVTSCGIGACRATATTTCEQGSVVDHCQGGTPAASDASCDGVDDDCNGTVDDDYVAVATSCGVGVCSAQGTRQCVGGQEFDSCTPGTPAASDASCNGADEDCNGTSDEDYVGVVTSCGIGACGATAVTTCEHGSVIDHCQPGTPAASDATCDGIDDDCNGTVDEDYVLTCAGATLQHCVNGTLSATDCRDTNPCNGIEGCSSGACQPGVPPDLDDGNPCTEDGCSPTSGISHTALEDGSACAEFSECNASAECVSFLPPDPATVAPALPGGNVSLFERMRFLFESDPPIQTGLNPTTIEPRTAAVLRGRVLDADGEPLPNVKVSIHSHPEYGQTRSRLDGHYDLMLNGGGLLTVAFERDGFFAAQRTLRVPWQDFAVADDVALVEADLMVTQMAFPSAVPQVHQASASVDADGVRVAALHVNPGTEAQLRLPDGSSVAVPSLAIRATEYTVGPMGRAAMPAELPATSGYTYAVELSADEAVAAGAEHVEFSQPVSFTVDNFLEFPTGTIVPVGAYDRGTASWLGEPNGRVMAVLGSTGGLANLDVDGSGVPAGAATLTALGISTEERQTLAGLYPAGTSFWRVSLLHFTSIDCNQPVAAATGTGGSTPASPAGSKPLDKPKEQCSSIIEVDNQILGERLPIAGTPFSLNYRSDRVIGRAVDRTVQIPVTGPTVSNTLIGEDVKISVAGRAFSFGGFPPQPNQSFTFAWDGRDGEGRALQGNQRVVVNVGATYPLRYAQPGEQAISFGQTRNGGGNVIAPSRDPGAVTLYTTYELNIGSYDNRQPGLGGWSLSPHHAYDPVGRTLYLGDGTRRSTNSISDTIQLFAGIAHSGVASNTGDGGPAKNALLNDPRGIAVGPDGAVYIGTRLSIRRVDPETHIITTIAGGKDTTTCNPNLIDGPPGDMCLYPRKLDVGADGALYMSDNPLGGSPDRIRRLDLKTGLITHIAGRAPGTNCVNRGDGGPARDAAICGLLSHAIGPDGSIYVLDTGPANNTDAIRKISPNGIIETIAAMNWSGNDDAADIAVGPDGSLYVTTVTNVLRILPSGEQRTFAGTTGTGFAGDGGPAINALLGNIGPWGVTVARDGRVFIGDTGNRLIRMVDQSGIINRIIGDTAANGVVGDGGAPLQAGLGGGILRTALAPDGSLYVVSRNNATIRVVHPAIDGNFSGEMLVPAESGNEVYRFDANGRHLETRHALTNGLLYTFNYDDDGRLNAIVDGDGNQTTIQRSPQGQIMAILAPFGQETLVDTNADGYVSKLTDPSGAQTQFGYDGDSGLLTSQIDARGGQHAYAYDAQGRLLSDEDAGDGHITLSRTGGGLNSIVTRTTAEGMVASYKTELLSTGVERRTMTREDGRTERIDTRPDQQTTVTQFDGTIETSTPGPDPVWGMAQPLVKSFSERLPSGSTLTVGETRSAVLANPLNPLTLQSDARSMTVNGKTGNATYNNSTRTQIYRTPRGRETQLVLDEQGRVLELSIPGLLPYTLSYDGAGRVDTISQGARSITNTYDIAGNLIAITDGINRVETFSHDANGRVVERIRPDGSIIGFGYDVLGNLTFVTPPGRPTHPMEYTPTNLLQSYSAPDLGSGLDVTRYAYDRDERPTQILRADGATIQMGYDAGGRLGTMTLPTGTLTLGYFPSTGRLQALSGPNGVNLSFQRDGDLLTNAQWSGSLNGSVGRTYDTFRRVITETVNGANSVSFGYDDDGLLTTAGSLSLSYDSARPVLTGTTVGQVTDARTYNEYGDHVTYSARFAGTEMFAQRFERDDVGRIIEKTETIGGVTTTYTYAYDQTDQLRTVSIDGVPTREYTYDGNGNRVSVEDGGLMITASYDAQDRLLSYGDFEYSYTEEGELQTKTNIVTGDLTTYTYDALGKLLAVELPDGRLVEYVLDGMGRRVGKKIDGATVQRWLYRDGLNPIAEIDSAGVVLRRFVYGSRMNVPEYVVQGGATYRVVSDHLGSVRRVVNVSNAADVLVEADYDEFGIATGSGLAQLPFSFAGGLFDSDTGLVQFGARHYDAMTGRWTRRDPIRFGGAQANLYAYVGNNPVMSADAEGKCFFLPLLIIPGICAAGGCEALLLGLGIVATGWSTGLLENPATALVNSSSGEFGGSISQAKATDEPRKENPPKAESPAWQGAEEYRRGLKRSGDEIWEWDPLHNDIEVYDQRGVHKGSRDPVSGEMYKGPVKGRYIKL